MSASVTYINSFLSRNQKIGAKMNNVLLVDTKGLAGVYVVTDGMNSQTVMVSHVNADAAYEIAIARGVVDPVLVYVPTESEETSVLWQN